MITMYTAPAGGPALFSEGLLDDPNNDDCEDSNVQEGTGK